MMTKKIKMSIEKIKQKYPTFYKIEEMRYNPDKPKEKEIQVRCKNHNCLNSKKQDGWFTPKYRSLSQRFFALENNNGNDGAYFYCCDECKQECPLFNFHYYNKNDNNVLYTSEEYKTWRTIILDRENYKCEYCENLATDVHHTRPQKLESTFILICIFNYLKNQ